MYYGRKICFFGKLCLSLHTTNLLCSNMSTIKPYLPVATFEQVLAYCPDDASTHTASPLVNAVCNVLCLTKCIEAGEVAKLLGLDRDRLTIALQLDLGMTLVEVVQQYRLQQILQFVNEHPDAPRDEVAKHFGYASRNSLWRFVERKCGTTVSGTPSHAKKEEWRDTMKRLIEMKNR